jgi:hypothetical protein
MTTELNERYQALSKAHREGLLNEEGEAQLSKARTDMQLSGQGLELNHEDNY